MLRDLAQFKLRDLTEAGWNFSLTLDHEYFDRDTRPLWKAKFWNHESGTTFIAEDPEMTRAVEKAIVKLEGWLYE
jgi:hypothetical protein